MFSEKQIFLLIITFGSNYSNTIWKIWRISQLREELKQLILSKDFFFFNP